MNEYCKILEIPENATVKEIKQAYRRKVSLTHPDVNPSPNAHEEFIEVNQAYEYLIKLKTGHVLNAKQNLYTRQRSEVSREEFMKEARERARANARMKYEEFIKSPYYQSQIIYFALFDYLIIGIIILIFGIVFAQLIINLGWLGLFYCSFFGILIAVLSKSLSKNIKILSLNQLKDGLKMLYEFDIIKALPLLIFNNFTFFSLGFSTFIPLKQLFFVFYLAPFLLVMTTYFYNKKKFQKDIKNKGGHTPFRRKNIFNRNPILMYWAIIPSLFSVLLITNYSFSTNHRVEKHHYTIEIQGGEISWMARLDNKKYEKYGGIRYFFDTEGFFTSHYVTLEIETGYWGIDVLKGYKITKY